MIFNSLDFFIFLLIVYCSYRCLSHNYQNILLLLASYAFYAFWDIRFLFLLIALTAVNYCCAILIANSYIRPRHRTTASLWIVSAFLLFITVQWQSTEAHTVSSLSSKISQILFSWPLGWTLLAILVPMVLLANLLSSNLRLSDNTRRTLFLTISIVTNLGVLAFFKYCNFFIDNVETLLTALDLDPASFHLTITLPIGISFYTFKAIGYCVDIYRGKVSPTLSYVDFAGFIAFFPALLAGPIDRASNLLAQFSSKRNPTVDQTLRGIHLIIYGLFKKVVIADSVIKTVRSVFESTGYVSWIDVLVATFLFTLQIYCDFSGYTDMARGTAKLFGFDLMANFKFPYFSHNPRQFWSHWHISLSTWLRDYLYIPLGGNRVSKTKTHRNLMLTMVLGGLWHGAAWNFVIWGFYHGVLLSLHRLLFLRHQATQSSTHHLFTFTKGLFFFCLTCYGWLLFRAPSLDKIAGLTSTLLFDFGNMNFAASWPRFAFATGFPTFLIIESVEGFGTQRPFYRKLPAPIWTALYAAIVFSIAIGLTTESTQFIYMEF